MCRANPHIAIREKNTLLSRVQLSDCLGCTAVQIAVAVAVAVMVAVVVAVAVAVVIKHLKFS